MSGLTDDQKALLALLQARFEQHMRRHAGLAWENIRARLEASPAKLRALGEMERTGGEPDVMGYDSAADEFIFMDCSAESPAGRRNGCYDQSAREARKEFRPESSALETAEAVGIALLTEAQYRALQTLGEFDTKTSSWVETPADIRALGGALFMDRRYGHVFVYHNGASSYYAARGFRGVLRV